MTEHFEKVRDAVRQAALPEDVKPWELTISIAPQIVADILATRRAPGDATHLTASQIDRELCDHLGRLLRTPPPLPTGPFLKRMRDIQKMLEGVTDEHPLSTKVMPQHKLPKLTQ